MAGLHHQFNGHELGQTPRDGEGQSPGMLQSMGHKELDTLAAEQQQQQHL